MEKKYFLFDFQNIIENLREKIKGEEDTKLLLNMLDDIKEDTDIEELSVYKNYLSKFDIKNSFDGYNFDVSDICATESDLDLLLRLIFASFSSEYKITFDKKSQNATLTISVKSGNNRIVKNLDELWSFQIINLFSIYLEEQLKLETSYCEEEEKESLQEQRNIKLIIFQKKVKEAKEESDGKELIDELDKLLNS